MPLAKHGDQSDDGRFQLHVLGSSASWLLQYTSPAGKRREMGLGPATRSSAASAGSSLTRARELAHAAREVPKRGTDPVDERQARRNSERQTQAAQKAAEAQESRTRDHHGCAVEPWMSEKHGADWIASLQNHVPRGISNAPIASIAAPQFLRAMQRMRSVEFSELDLRILETRQRVRQRLEAVSDEAVFSRAVPQQSRGRHPPQDARDDDGEEGRLIRRAAVPRGPDFMVRLRQEQGMAPRCSGFAILTASRTGEVLGAPWLEFDIDARTWSLPSERMQAGEPHVVYLWPAARHVLAGQRQLGTEFFFPSPILGRQPLSNMAMLNVLSRMTLRDRTTVHGLCRATFSTWANDMGAARPPIIEACLAHKEADKVAAAYKRAQFTDERRVLMNAWSAFLAQPVSNVVPLRAA